MKRKPLQPHHEDYRWLESLLSPVTSFVAKHPSLTIEQFNYHTVHDLALFSIEPDLDFPFMEDACERIAAALPAIKRIFSKPIINLTDTSEVLPVETVRIINQETILHLASHTENVADLTKDGIKPEKLLTRIYLDDYGIYENLVFCNLIDGILRFARRGIIAMRDLVYANETIEFNLLERVNHLNYFLSIGKLHMGYIRDFDKFYVLAKNLYSKMEAIIGAITPRLHKPVYSENRVRNKNLRLRKTNIFLMQKDYHQVYLLQKWFLSKGVYGAKEQEDTDLTKLSDSYFKYVENLLVFALESFSFAPAKGSPVSMDALNMSFAYKKWTILVKALKNKGLLLQVKKDKTRNVLLYPDVSYEPTDPKSHFGITYGADEMLSCSPYEKEIDHPGVVFLSPDNVESFRRLQQVILRAMIYSDTKRGECPFCEGNLEHAKKGDYDQCPICHTEIKKGLCPTGGPYFYTTIAGRRPEAVNVNEYKKSDLWKYYRKKEAILHFRNITPVNERGEPICPHCGQVHKNKL